FGIAVGLVASATGNGPTSLSHERLVVLMAACYLGVRFGGAWLLDLLTVHRGMFHSLPAACIAALGAFLLCDAATDEMRLFFAGGALAGFLSHLLMDELWSIHWRGLPVGLKRSAGSVLKLFSRSLPATLT